MNADINLTHRALKKPEARIIDSNTSKVTETSKRIQALVSLRTLEIKRTAVRDTTSRIVKSLVENFNAVRI
ncbi:MAG: hypothetical protein ACRCXZ_10555 [Patescibacteria group bacterium]